MTKPKDQNQDIREEKERVEPPKVKDLPQKKAIFKEKQVRELAEAKLKRVETAENLEEEIGKIVKEILEEAYDLAEVDPDKLAKEEQDIFEKAVAAIVAEVRKENESIPTESYKKALHLLKDTMDVKDLSALETDELYNYGALFFKMLKHLKRSASSSDDFYNEIMCLEKACDKLGFSFENFLHKDVLQVFDLDLVTDEAKEYRQGLEINVEDASKLQDVLSGNGDEKMEKEVAEFLKDNFFSHTPLENVIEALDVMKEIMEKVEGKKNNIETEDFAQLIMLFDYEDYEALGTFLMGWEVEDMRKEGQSYDDAYKAAA